MTQATATPEPSPGTRPLSGWERWLVPGILGGIACAQILATQLGPLSPWKGGGFGMFSTVDGPGMRVLMAEGIDADGRIAQLDVLGSLAGDLAEHLQAKPNLGDLGPMAAGLLDQPWVSMDAEDQYLAQLQQERNGGGTTGPATGDAREQELGAHTPGRRLPQARPQPAQAPAPLEEARGGAPALLYRVRAPEDLPEIPSHTLRTVRLQWWRLRWDDAAARVYLEPLGPEVRTGERIWPDERAAAQENGPPLEQ